MSEAKLLPLALLAADLGYTQASLYTLKHRHGWTWLTTTTPGGRRKAYWIDPDAAVAWIVAAGSLGRARILREAAEAFRRKEAGR